jgi:hypothetical protein
LGVGRTLLNKTARRSEQFVSIGVADLFVGHRSAARPGLDFASAIFLTPIFCFASDFNSRTSFLVHSRLTTFFVAFLAMSAPVVEPGF